MDIDFFKASFKDFERIPGFDVNQKSSYFNEYLTFLKKEGRLNYRLVANTGCGPELKLSTSGKPRTYVSLVSNDYLGFTQHPEVKKAAILGIEIFGTGAGASPAIGGQCSYHEELEYRIAAFFKKDSAIIYTTCCSCFFRLC